MFRKGILQSLDASFNNIEPIRYRDDSGSVSLQGHRFTASAEAASVGLLRVVELRQRGNGMFASCTVYANSSSYPNSLYTYKQTRQSTALNYLEFITAEACAENILMENQPEIMNYDDLCKTFSATRIKSFSRLLNLPEDLLFILLDHLELVSLYHLGLTCRHLHDMVSTRHQCLRKHVLIKQVSLVILPCLYW